MKLSTSLPIVAVGFAAAYKLPASAYGYHPQTATARLPETTTARLPETTTAHIPETTTATIFETTTATIFETTTATIFETTTVTIPGNSTTCPIPGNGTTVPVPDNGIAPGNHTYPAKPSFLLPSCAHYCIDAAIKKTTSCGPFEKDVACVCENYGVISFRATDCVLSACGWNKAKNKVLIPVNRMCGIVGYDHEHDLMKVN